MLSIEGKNKFLLWSNQMEFHLIMIKLNKNPIQQDW